MKRHDFRDTMIGCAIGAVIGVGVPNFVMHTTGCATVAGDPVATNAARFKDESHRVSIIYDAWAKALEADARREQAKISNARREQAKQIRIQIDSIMAEWKASVDAGQPFSWTDSAVSLLGAMAAFAEEASE